MNKPTDTADAIIKSAIFDIALNAVEAAAIADAPWLAIPVVKQIFELALNAIGKQIYIALSNVVDFTIITIETEHQKNEYDNAVASLKLAVNKPEVTQNEIDKARDEIRARLAALIKLN